MKFWIKIALELIVLAIDIILLIVLYGLELISYV